MERYNLNAELGQSAQTVRAYQHSSHVAFQTLGIGVKIFFALIATSLVGCQHRRAGKPFVPDSAYLEDLDLVLSVWGLPKVNDYETKYWDPPKGSKTPHLFNRNRNAMRVTCNSQPGRWYLSLDGTSRVRLLLPSDIERGDFGKLALRHVALRDIKFSVGDGGSNQVQARTSSGEPVGWLIIDQEGYLLSLFWARNLVSLKSGGDRPSPETIRKCFGKPYEIPVRPSP